jgi:hypothetical protein
VPQMNSQNMYDGYVTYRVSGYDCLMSENSQGINPADQNLARVFLQTFANGFFFSTVFRFSHKKEI